MFYPDNHAHQEVMSSSSSVNHSSCQETEGERVQETEPGCGEIQHNREKHLALIENAEGIRLVLRNEDTAVEPNSVRDDRCQVGERQHSAQGMKEEPVVPADRGMKLGIKCLRRDRRRSERKHLKEAVPTTRRRPEELKGSGPFFFVGGGNGATIVTAYCESRGWQRVYDKTREDYKLKWCETKSPITYYNFKDGEQLLYQIPNNKVLTTKIGLLNSLREYDRVSSKVNHGRGLRRLKMEEFFPTSFRMDIRDERDAFFAQEEAIGINSSSTNVWICKPTGLNQGRGIFLLRSEEEIAAFRARLQSMEASQSHRKLPYRLPQARIVQRYIQNPLLLRGRKFDVRSYFLIACTKPYMVFFRHGYVRLTCDLYDPNSNNLSAHLTNQYMQKKNPLYSELKEETVWSMARLNAYINERFRVTKGLPSDWVLGAFAKRMQQIVTQCFLAVKAKLERKLGYFDLIGCDFMIDEDFKVWLLEMNCNPALHTNCQVLKEVVPSIVTETLDLSLEIFNKRRCGLTLLPLVTQRDFVLLYNGDSGPVSDWPNGRLGPLGTPHLKNTDTQKHNLRTQKGAAVTMAEQRSEIGSTASALQVSPSFSTVEGPKPRNLVQAPKPGKTRPPPHKPTRVELHLVKDWPRQSGRLEQRYSGSIRGTSTNKSRTSPTPSGRSHVADCQKPTGCYLNTTRFLLAKVQPSPGAWMVIQEPCPSQEGAHT